MYHLGWKLAPVPAREGKKDHLGHRRRIKIEGKAKVVSSDWREEFIQFLAAPAVLQWTI